MLVARLWCAPRRLLMVCVCACMHGEMNQCLVRLLLQLQRHKTSSLYTHFKHRVALYSCGAHSSLCYMLSESQLRQAKYLCFMQITSHNNKVSFSQLTYTAIVRLVMMRQNKKTSQCHVNCFKKDDSLPGRLKGG
jgi:hypothetical protein